MRTSLSEIAQIDKYISGKLKYGEKLLFEANQLVDPELSNNIRLQHAVLYLVRLFGRARLKEEIQVVGHHLFHSPEKKDFREEINEIFKET